MSFIALTVLTAAVSTATPTPAAVGTVGIDPETKVRFETSMLGLFSMSGAFSEVSGTIALNGPEPGDEDIDVTIRTGSVHTDDNSWQDTLCDAEFFDCAGHPEMYFESTSIEIKGKDHAQIHGQLTMRGVSKPVTFEARYEPITDKNGNTIAYKNFHAAGHLSRREFGMTSLYPVIGDDVTIEIESGATIAPK